MQIADDIGSRVVVKGDNDTIPKSEILAGGQPTGAVMTGEVFEAAVRMDDCLLVFLTDGVPFEEGLNIALLDGDFRILDRKKLGVMYATGSFEDLTLEPPDTVRFRFLGGGTWTATVREPGLIRRCRLDIHHHD